MADSTIEHETNIQYQSALSKYSSIGELKSKNTLKSKNNIKNSSTFVNNMSLPVHRWFRYSAGFSAQWVDKVILENTNDIDATIFDPFVGSGTVLLSSELAGYKSYGIDSHPFVSKITSAKLHWRKDIDTFINFASEILNEAKRIDGEVEKYPPLIHKCFTEEKLKELDSLKTTLESKENKTPEYELTWLALTSILRKVSHVGTAQWQYVLPQKSKKNPLEPFPAFKTQIRIMAEDMAFMQSRALGPTAEFYQEDARSCESIKPNSIDLVITSPPYANNYDYADAARLELSFYGEVKKYSDLQKKVRSHLVRSCTQHVSGMQEVWQKMLDDKKLSSIKEEINIVCNKLEKERENHGGRKNYHIMIASYFYDLADVWIALRRLCKDDSKICFVIGDSAPYGIYVPVHEWLGELALSAGFKHYSFEKIRDRNTKWKNRKHNVLLQEGHLWVEG